MQASYPLLLDFARLDKYRVIALKCRRCIVVLCGKCFHDESISFALGRTLGELFIEFILGYTYPVESVGEGPGDGADVSCFIPFYPRFPDI